MTISFCDLPFSQFGGNISIFFEFTRRLLQLVSQTHLLLESGRLVKLTEVSKLQQSLVIISNWAATPAVLENLQRRCCSCQNFAALLQQRAITFFLVKETQRVVEQQCFISFRRNRRHEMVLPPFLSVEIESNYKSEIMLRRVNLVIKGKLLMLARHFVLLGHHYLSFQWFEILQLKFF